MSVIEFRKKESTDLTVFGRSNPNFHIKKRLVLPAPFYFADGPLTLPLSPQGEGWGEGHSF
jgi:hypothetical protein